MSSRIIHTDPEAQPSLQGSASEVLIAYDSSGSTAGCFNYHAKTQEVLDKYPNATILAWNTKRTVVSREQMNRLNAKRDGGGGTQPSLIAEYVEEENFVGTLVIITDGQVSTDHVEACDEHLTKGRQFHEVVCYLINTGDTVNMSVTCPFTRNSPHTVMTFDDRHDVKNPTAVTSISPLDIEAFSMLSSIATIEEYESQSESIERVMVARTMGTAGDPLLLDAVLALKKRLTEAQSKIKGASDSVTALTAALESGNTNSALACARVVVREYYGLDQSVDLSWSAKLSRLVSMCQGALGRGAFDMRSVQSAICADRIRRAECIAPADPSTVPVQDDDAVECGARFQCPISLEEVSSTVLLVTEGTSVLADLDAATVNDCLNCPLNALKYPQVVQRIVDRLDHPFGLASLQEGMKVGSMEFSPLTRRPVMGALCLGRSAESVAATNWTLAHLFTEGKLSGNVDLWFAVVWLIVKRPAVPYLGREVIEAVQAHMLFRLKNQKTFISLSGLPELPTTRARLDVAVWFVMASSALSLEAVREPLRAHIAHVDSLRELCELSGFELPEGTTAYISRLQCVLAMLASVKKPASTLKWAVNALVNPTVSVDTTNVRDVVKEGELQCPAFVPVDGLSVDPVARSAARAQDPVLRRFGALTDDELVYFASLVDPSLSASAVSFPFAFVVPAHRAESSDGGWRYGTGKVTTKVRVHIHPQTCRPQSCFPTGRSWRDEAETTYGFDATQLFSRHELFGRFVDKFHFYPNRDELMIFAFNRIVSSVSLHKCRLPACVEQLIDETIEDYKSVAEAVDPLEFSKRRLASLSLQSRLKLEKASA